MNRPYILIASLAPILATAAVPEPVQPPGTTPQEAIDAAREWIHKNHAHILLNQQYVVSDDVLRYQDADFILCPRLADLLRLRVLPGFDDKNIICLENEVDTQEWRHGESMGRTWRKALDLFMPVLNLAMGNEGLPRNLFSAESDRCRELARQFADLGMERDRLRSELGKMREELMIATTRLQALTSVRNPGPEVAIESTPNSEPQPLHDAFQKATEAPGPPPPPAPPAPKETPKAVLPPKTTVAPKKAPPVKPTPATPAPSP